MGRTLLDYGRTGSEYGKTMVGTCRNMFHLGQNESTLVGLGRTLFKWVGSGRTMVGMHRPRSTLFGIGRSMVALVGSLSTLVLLRPNNVGSVRNMVRMGRTFAETGRPGSKSAEYGLSGSVIIFF